MKAASSCRAEALDEIVCRLHFHAPAAFGGVRADMRRKEGLGETRQGAGVGFFFECIYPAAGDPVLLERAAEGRFVDEAAAAGVEGDEAELLADGSGNLREVDDVADVGDVTGTDSGAGRAGLGALLGDFLKIFAISRDEQDVTAATGSFEGDVDADSRGGASDERDFVSVRLAALVGADATPNYSLRDESECNTESSTEDFRAEC